MNADKTTLLGFQHLFALRSKHKGQHRTYYLAADSELDMTKWVECLCNVCGCKPVDNQDEGSFVPFRIKFSFTFGESHEDISRFFFVIRHLRIWKGPVPLGPYPSRSNSLFSCIFLKTNGRSIGWHPTPACGWGPSVWQILDQPLFSSETYNVLSRITNSSRQTYWHLRFCKTTVQRIAPDLFMVFASPTFATAKMLIFDANTGENVMREQSLRVREKIEVFSL